MPTKSWIEVPIDQEIEDVCEGAYVPYFFPTEGGTALFSFTDAEFTQVLSALINGAALTFPDEWLQVVWYFLRNVECPVSLCDAIADCIANNPATRQAIRDLVLTDQAIHDYIYDTAVQAGLTEGERNTNILKPDECDPDYVFNQASELITLLNDLTEDLFESIEIATNPVERAQLLVQGAPGVGILPFDELIGLANMLVENVKEEYDGAYDEGVYDVLRCGLFCLAKDSCVLTIADAISYYEQALPASFGSDPLQLFLGVVNFISNGDFPTDTAVYAMHLFVLSLIQRAQSVLGIDFATMGLRVIAAGDEPNNDWETICEDCEEIPNLRLEVYGGFAEDMLEFIDNLDVDTSVYRVHRRYTGDYATGAYRSVGAVPFYIIGSSVVSGTSWEITAGYYGNFLGENRYALSEIPCYEATTNLLLRGVDSTTVDEVAQITVSRNPCPIWEVYFSGWGTILEQDVSHVVVQGADIGGPAYRVGLHTIGGIVFHIDTITYDGTKVNFGSYFNADGVEVFALPAPGMDIQGFYFGLSEIISVTITGHIV